MLALALLKEILIFALCFLCQCIERFFHVIRAFARPKHRLEFIGICSICGICVLVRAFSLKKHIFMCFFVFFLIKTCFFTPRMAGFCFFWVYRSAREVFPGISGISLCLFEIFAFHTCSLPMAQTVDWVYRSAPWGFLTFFRSFKEKYGKSIRNC